MQHVLWLSQILYLLCPNANTAKINMQKLFELFLADLKVKDKTGILVHFW